jgi:hypothetical protein
MLDPVDNYHALFGALMSDVSDARKALKESDTQFNRRSYIRIVFALIEGEIHLRKQYALMLHDLGMLQLSEPEVALLREKQAGLNNKGEPECRPLFLRLPQNLKFSFRMEAKAFKKQYGLQTQGEEWESFLTGIEIRNRITHPKRFEDFEISDEELLHIEKVLEWYKTALSHNAEGIRTGKAQERRHRRKEDRSKMGRGKTE